MTTVWLITGYVSHGSLRRCLPWFSTIFPFYILCSSGEALSAAHTQDMGSYPLLPGGGNTYVNYLQFSLKGNLSLLLHLWQEEKGLTEDEMLRWHHQLNGIAKNQTGQWLNNNNNTHTHKVRLLSHLRLFATPLDHSLPGSSVHGTHQARVLECCPFLLWTTTTPTYLFKRLYQYGLMDIYFIHCIII